LGDDDDNGAGNYLSVAKLRMSIAAVVSDGSAFKYLAAGRAGNGKAASAFQAHRGKPIPRQSSRREYETF
jgi:hypothetical protein